jgi:hypothetical protein
MRKKTMGISLAVILFILVSLAVSSPAFMPEDPDQPIRPLLLKDQTLKEQYVLMIENPDLSSQVRSEKLTDLSQSYASLSEQAGNLNRQGIEHGLLLPLESYFKDLSDALSSMALAFENTDPQSLILANDRLKELDQEFQNLKDNA